MERMKFLPEGGNGMSDICSDDGAVKVSTGMGKRDTSGRRRLTAIKRAIL